MLTRLLRMDDGGDSRHDRAVELDADCMVRAALAAGGIVAYPTETYYGLAVSPWNADAVERLLNLKGTRDGKPVPLILASTGVVLRVASLIPPALDALAAAFWPGPLTLVLASHPGLAPGIVAGQGTVGVRVAGLHTARRVAWLAQGAVTSTSANPSGAPAPRTAAQVLEYFSGQLDIVIDGGETPGGEPSTVLDITIDPARVLRLGAISRDSLSRCIRLG